MTILVELYGGPGSRKDTTMASVFTTLKQAGITAEQVQEAAKDLAWDAMPRWGEPGQTGGIRAIDQVGLLAEQMRREERLLGRVDVAITCSPVLLGAFFDQHYNDSDKTMQAIREYWQWRAQHGVRAIRFFLRRQGNYDTKGRFETAEEASAIDTKQRTLLELLGLDYQELIDTVPANTAEIIKCVSYLLQKNN